MSTYHILGSGIGGGLLGGGLATLFTTRVDDDDRDVQRKRRALSIDSVGLTPMRGASAQGQATGGMGLAISGSW